MTFEKTRVVRQWKQIAVEVDTEYFFDTLAVCQHVSSAAEFRI
jgi:hypothetical protein